MFIDIIFHLPDIPFISPMVQVWWPGEVIDLLNLIPQEIWCWGNVPQGRCVDFIGACLALREIDRGRLEVWNIPIPREWFGSGGEHGWYHRLIAELRASTNPPVLINLNPHSPGNLAEASRGGVELCRLMWNQGRDVLRWVVDLGGIQEAESEAAADRPRD